MRKFLLLLLLIPIFGIGQTKNVINSTRVFAKSDKVLEFEKALAAHAQKYHSGDWKWRVFEIQTGPDAGGYHITEGPSSWDAIDSRGNLGTEHNNDWNKNVAIYLTDRLEETYSVFVDSLSTVALTNYSDKIILTHIYPKPGMIGGLTGLVQKLKKVWTDGNETVAVYQAVASGDPQIITSTRLKEGLKELASGYRKPMAERYNAANGAGSWDVYQSDYSKYVEKRWSELLFYRADLSSK
ncbi:MAG TPA: hypothetical protein VK588_01560 [Chitinophagaceae bacterium]|nr:hypothetical protein [Chitinophagaceae bacterium]